MKILGKLNESAKEPVNHDKWRRAMNGKSIGRFIFFLQDYSGNKKRYVVNIKYNETVEENELSLSEILIGGWEDKAATSFALSNMQNKPGKLFGMTDSLGFTDAYFNTLIDAFSKDDTTAEKFINEIFEKEWLGKDIKTLVSDWIKTGVMKFVKYEFKK